MSRSLTTILAYVSAYSGDIFQVITYRLLYDTELFEFRPQGLVIGVPCEATEAHVRDLMLSYRHQGTTHPMNSLDMVRDSNAFSGLKVDVLLFCCLCSIG